MEKTKKILLDLLITLSLLCVSFFYLHWASPEITSFKYINWLFLILFSLLLIINIYLNKIFLRKSNLTKTAAIFLFLFFLMLLYLNCLPSYQVIIVSLGIVIGFFNVYLNEKIFKEIKEKQEQEQVKENQRKKSFSKKFPSLASIPIIKNISEWSYKEGPAYSLSLLGVFFLGFVNRAKNLSKFPFFQDEGHAILTSLGLENTGRLIKFNPLLEEVATTPYPRNYLFTYLVNFFNKFFGFNEFSTRLPVLIFSLLGIILFYFLLKYIFKNKNIALIGTLIFSLNDVLIYYSRFARGYFALILFSILIFYLIYKMRRSNNWKMIISIISLKLFIVFYLGNNFHKTIFFLFPLVIFSIAEKFYFQIKNRKKFYFWFLILILFTAFFSLEMFGITTFSGYNYGISQFNLNIETITPNTSYFSFLFVPYRNTAIIITLLFVSVFALFRYKKSLSLYGVLTFLPVFLTTSYITTKEPNVRYMAMFQPILIIYLSFILFYFYNLLNDHFAKKRFSVVLFMILLFVLIIPLQFPKIDIALVTIKSQAEWQGFEGERMHRRLAFPELKKAHDYIFQNYNNFSLIVPSHGGIYWPGSFYLNQYKNNYPQKKFEFWTQEEYNSPDFHLEYPRKADVSIKFEEALQKENNFVIVTAGNLINENISNYLNSRCFLLSNDLNVQKYEYLKDDLSGEFFPYLYKCNKHEK